MVVSHDRAFLRHLTDRVLWVDRGEVRRLDRGFGAFEAWRDKLYEEEDEARHKLDRLIKAEGRWAVEGISARRRRNQGRVRRLLALRAERREAISRPGAARLELEAGAARLAGPGPLLILMDVNLRRMNGFETIEEMDRRLGAAARRPGLAVMMLTSSDSPLDKTRAQALPMVAGFLTKPLDAAAAERLAALFAAEAAPAGGPPA